MQCDAACRDNLSQSQGNTRVATISIVPQPTPTELSSTRNLKRLFTLRSLMISGELIAIVGIHFLTDVRLALAAMLGIVSLLTVVNLWTWLQVRSGTLVTDQAFFYHLCIDVAAIAGLLYFSGGATNPFAWLFLIPLIIAATVLSADATWAIAGLSILCYSLLMRFYIPLGEHAHMHQDDSFNQHVLGMWFGFVMSAILIAWFVVGMANTLRERDRALALAREKSLRDEKLVALGTLATGAAHELGTPLATIAIVARELERADIPDTMRRKLNILSGQIGRCKSALSTLSASAGEARAESGGLVPVESFLQDLIKYWEQQRSEARIEYHFSNTNDQATIVNDQTLIQALMNLLNNAADASQEPLVMEVHWDQADMTIDILDRGPGLQDQVTNRLYQPKTSQKEFGMGLGLFLAHATIQRLDGEITLTNRDGGGTRSRIRIPLTKR
jgi:two-component system, sensor histidine kinase RegB